MLTRRCIVYRVCLCERFSFIHKLETPKKNTTRGEPWMENTLSGKPALLEFLRADETGEYTSGDTCSSLFHSFSFEFVRVSLALLSSTLLFVFAFILLREERDVFF